MSAVAEPRKAYVDFSGNYDSVMGPVLSLGMTLPWHGPGLSVCQATFRLLTCAGRFSRKVGVRVKVSFIQVETGQDVRQLESCACGQFLGFYVFPFFNFVPNSDPASWLGGGVLIWSLQEVSWRLPPLSPLLLVVLGQDSKKLRS